MNKDQIEGRAKDIDGVAEEAVGKPTGIKDLQIRSRLARTAEVFRTELRRVRERR